MTAKVLGSSIHSSSNCWAASISGQGGGDGVIGGRAKGSSDFPLCDSMGEEKTF
jgi:hypothetical protein